MKEYFVEQKCDAIEHARMEYPNESCGAIIENEYVAFENRAEDKSNTFLIDNKHFTTAYIEGRVEAVIHSHNDYGMASKQDQIQQLEMDVPFGIIDMVNRSVRNFLYWGDNLPIQDFLMRPFFYGIYDCFSLMRDWYRKNMNIVLPNPSREFAFWYKGERIFEEWFEDKTDYFEDVDLNDIRIGDVLFYNIYYTEYANHIGVALDKGLVLHHFYNQVSTHYPLSYSQQYLIKAMRLRKKYK